MSCAGGQRAAAHAALRARAGAQGPRHLAAAQGQAPAGGAVQVHPTAYSQLLHRFFI